MASRLDPFSSDILSSAQRGESTASLSRRFKVNVGTMRDYLKTLGVSDRYGRGLLKERYFEKIDSYAKAYLLGFIAGDGCVQERYGVPYHLTITLHERDRAVLEFFRSELGITRPIREIPSLNHVRITVSSKALCQDLAALGIVPRKSLILRDIHKEVPINYRPTVSLGYFDADGSCSVHYREYVTKSGKTTLHRKQSVQVRGTQEMLLGTVSSLGIQAYHLSHADNIPSLVISSLVEFTRFYRNAYRNAPFSLDRKRSKFLEIVDQDQTISSPQIS
jgi:hypothetical protein